MDEKTRAAIKKRAAEILAEAPELTPEKRELIGRMLAERGGRSDR